MQLFLEMARAVCGGLEAERRETSAHWWPHGGHNIITSADDTTLSQSTHDGITRREGRGRRRLKEKRKGALPLSLPSSDCAP
jgi:hypothetical protein